MGEERLVSDGIAHGPDPGHLGGQVLVHAEVLEADRVQAQLGQRGFTIKIDHPVEAAGLLLALDGENGGKPSLSWAS